MFLFKNYQICDYYSKLNENYTKLNENSRSLTKTHEIWQKFTKFNDNLKSSTKLHESWRRFTKFKKDLKTKNLINVKNSQKPWTIPSCQYTLIIIIDVGKTNFLLFLFSTLFYIFSEKKEKSEKPSTWDHKRIEEKAIKRKILFFSFKNHFAQKHCMDGCWVERGWEGGG